MERRLRVLKRFNCRACVQLESGRLEEARETVTAAVNHIVLKYCATSADQVAQQHACALMLQWQTRVSILLLRKIGLRYETLGQQRDDKVLVAIGEKLVMRSVHLLRIHPMVQPPMKWSTSKRAVLEQHALAITQHSSCAVATFLKSDHGSCASPDGLADVVSSVTTTNRV
jgi:hypothetical protein